MVLNGGDTKWQRPPSHILYHLLSAILADRKYVLKCTSRQRTGVGTSTGTCTGGSGTGTSTCTGVQVQLVPDSEVVEY